MTGWNVVLSLLVGKFAINMTFFIAILRAACYTLLVPLIWVGSIISNRASKVSRSLSLSIYTMSYAHSLRAPLCILYATQSWIPEESVWVPVHALEPLPSMIIPYSVAKW